MLRVASTGPGIPIPTPTTRSQSRWCSVTSWRISLMSRWSRTSGPRSVSHGPDLRAMMCAWRSVASKVKCVRPKSTPMMMPADSLKWTRVGRRPPLGAALSVSPSRTISSARRPSTILLTVVRERPVRRAMATRARGPCWRMRRKTSVMFASRMSWRSEARWPTTFGRTTASRQRALGGTPASDGVIGRCPPLTHKVACFPLVCQVS